MNINVNEGCMYVVQMAECRMKFPYIKPGSMYSFFFYRAIYVIQWTIFTILAVSREKALAFSEAIWTCCMCGRWIWIYFFLQKSWIGYNGRLYRSHSSHTCAPQLHEQVTQTRATLTGCVQLVPLPLYHPVSHKLVYPIRCIAVKVCKHQQWEQKWTHLPTEQ